MRIAVEGCMHGDLDTVYKSLQYAEMKHSIKIDLLLCCGDFQVFFFIVQVPKFRLLKSLKYAYKDTQLLFCCFQLLFIVEVVKFLLLKALNIASKNTQLYFVVVIFRL
jgi:hypothetical protein